MPRPAAATSRDAAQFMWDRANARLCAARSPADFDEAAALYRELIADGVRNGPLFYNYGLALLEANHPEDALYAFERAERFAGAQPEIRQNLLRAMEAARGEASTAPLAWYRPLLFWHFDIDLPTRLTIALAGFLLLCLAGSMRLWNRPLAARRTHLLGVVVLILFGSSVGASLHAESRDQARIRTLREAHAAREPVTKENTTHANARP